MSNTFVTPPPSGEIHDYAGNQVYEIGSVLTVTWIMNFTDASLTLLQDRHIGNTNTGAMISATSNVEEYAWDVSYEGLDPTISNVYYLEVATQDRSVRFTSHYFNLTKVDTAVLNSTSTTSQPSSISSTEPFISTPVVTSARSSTSTTSTSSSLSSSSIPAANPGITSLPTSTALSTSLPTPLHHSTHINLGSGPIAGIVISLVVVCLLFAALWLWFKRRKSNRSTPAEMDAFLGAPAELYASPPEMGGNPISEIYTSSPPQVYRNIVMELYDGPMDKA